MDTLSLAPLPSETAVENRNFRQAGSEGFLDEKLVSRLIARGAYDRASTAPEGMALSSSEDDYAGWVLPVASPFRETMDSTPGALATARLPGSPRLRKDPEPGIDSAYEGGHRWWLFGMSGAMTCCIMALTIFSLAQRHGMGEMPPAPVSSAHSQATPALAVERPALSPALTTVLPGER